MCPKGILWYKFIALALILVLIVPVLAACGKGKEATPTPIATQTPTATTSTVPTIEASIPTVEGPITGPGAPFLTNTLSDQALASAGYEAKEYFVSGTATSYRAVNDLQANGMWEVEPAESAAYKTRILVYRPVDPAAFNGTVVMEWFNVSGGLEAAPDWTSMHNELIRRGYAWIGVSAQIGGVEGGGVTLGLYNLPLKEADAKRYGSLNHPGDGYCYDIFSQAARAIRNPGDVNTFAGYHVERILAVGESQSAFRLVTYINAIYPRVQLFDGFLVHSRAGSASSLGNETMADLSKSSLATVFLRTDIKVPILILETETDVVLFGYYKARQDDTDNIRLWEMAGTAHADLYTIKGAGDTGTDSAVANVVEVSNPVPGVIECPLPINSGPQHFIAKAAIYQLDKWVRIGITPPTADRLEVAGDPPAFVLDKFGNVKGGIRTPYVDLPIARLSGEGQPVGLDDPSGRFLWGTTKLFDKATLAALYPDHDTYVTAVKNATDAAVKAGFLMPEDGELIKAAGAASNIGTATPTVVPTTPAPTVTAGPNTPAEIHTGLDINSTIGQLLDNPDTKAVIDKWIPGFSTNPQVSLARGMTFGQVQPLSSGAITPEMVAGIAADLLAIK